MLLRVLYYWHVMVTHEFTVKLYAMSASKHDRMQYTTENWGLSHYK